MEREDVKVPEHLNRHTSPNGHTLRQDHPRSDFAERHMTSRYWQYQSLIRQSQELVGAAVDQLHRFEAELAGWEAEAEELATSFDLDWHSLHPAALDALRFVERKRGHWYWTGELTSKGTPTLRISSRYSTRTNDDWVPDLSGYGPRTSVFMPARILHAVLVDHDLPGSLYPQCAAGVLCVRPEHRCRWCADG